MKLALNFNFATINSPNSPTSHSILIEGPHDLQVIDRISQIKLITLMTSQFFLLDGAFMITGFPDRANFGMVFSCSEPVEPENLACFEEVASQLSLCFPGYTVSYQPFGMLGPVT